MSVFFRYVKKPILILGVIAISLFIILLQCENDDWQSMARQKHDMPNSALQRWIAPPVEKTTTWPLAKKRRADAVMKTMPPGARVVEVNGKQICSILPSGEILVPDGIDAVVYAKPPRLVELEARPWVGAGVVGDIASITPAVVGGVSVIRVERAHIGIGGCVSSSTASAVAIVSYPIWHRVEIGCGGGYGTTGACGFAGLGVGLL